ncbi:hypothetical protein CEXT_48181 [Caerostris extrusa]|uniref:Ribosomal protein S3 n=1 Tax=Caerostris extrusa TaxID=172846 RepID=A0AAV4VHQ4_CAEEX|nr:hypothetical protein CEXT_48181 [Caerostris extrusa]
MDICHDMARRQWKRYPEPWGAVRLKRGIFFEASLGCHLRERKHVEKWLCRTPNNGRPLEQLRTFSGLLKKLGQQPIMDICLTWQDVGGRNILTVGVRLTRIFFEASNALGCHVWRGSMLRKGYIEPEILSKA